MERYQTQTLIALPALNEEIRIKQTLLHVRSYGDVVVYDNNSDDNTAKIATNFGAKVIHCEQRGYENVIIKIIRDFMISNYKILCLIDADGEVGLKNLHEGLDIIKDIKIDGVLGERLYIKRLSERVVVSLFKYFNNINDIYCGFKILKKSAISDNIRLNTFGTSIINKKSSFYNIKIKENYRIDSRLQEQKSNLSFKLLLHGLRGFLS